MKLSRIESRITLTLTWTWLRKWLSAIHKEPEARLKLYLFIVINEILEKYIIINQKNVKKRKKIC